MGGGRLFVHIKRITLSIGNYPENSFWSCHWGKNIYGFQDFRLVLAVKLAKFLWLHARRQSNEIRREIWIFYLARQDKSNLPQNLAHKRYWTRIGHFNLELGCWGLLKTCARFGSVSDWSILGWWSVYERNRLTTSEELRAPSGGRLFLYCEARTLDEQARAEGTKATRADPSTMTTGHATSYEWTHAARILAGETRWSRGRPGWMLPQKSCVAAATCLLTHLLASAECCCNIWPTLCVVFYCNYRTQLIFNHFLFAH